MFIGWAIISAGDYADPAVLQVSTKPMARSWWLSTAGTRAEAKPSLRDTGL